MSDIIADTGPRLADLSGATPLGRAQARLAATRARLRQQFIPPPALPRGARAPGSGSVSRWLQGLAAGPWQFLRKLVRNNPVAETVIDGISHWWANHPLRDPVELAGAEIASEWRSSGAPLLRRHPVASVAIAGLAGAALVTARPWRSARVQAQLRPLPRRLGRWLMAQVPLQTVLTSLVVLVASRGGGAAAPDHSTSDSPGKSAN